MKPRRTAALALVGWYLIVPPIPVDRTGPASKWPLANYSQWGINETFESSAACEAARNQYYETFQDPTKFAQLLAEMAKSDPEGYRNRNDEFARFQADNAVCISADDPRLKGN